MIGAQRDQILLLIGSLNHRNQQTLVGLLHPGQLVPGQPFYGLVPLLVAEPGLLLQGIQVHGGASFEEIHNQLLILGQLNGLFFRFHLRET